MSIDQQIKVYLSHLWDRHFPKPAQCERCRQHGPLRWHGHYERTLLTATQTYEVPVRRLFCVLCRHTFAVLPSFVEKFHRYAKETIRLALHLLKSRTYDGVADWFMEHGACYIATLTLYQWRRKFV